MKLKHDVDVFALQSCKRRLILPNGVKMSAKVLTIYTWVKKVGKVSLYEDQQT